MTSIVIGAAVIAVAGVLALAMAHGGPAAPQPPPPQGWPRTPARTAAPLEPMPWDDPWTRPTEDVPWLDPEAEQETTPCPSTLPA